MSRNKSEKDFSRDFGYTVPLKLNFHIIPRAHKHHGLTSGVYLISTIDMNEQEFCIDGGWHRMADYNFGAVEPDDQALALLKQPECKTCGDKGKALKDFRLYVLKMGLRRFAEWIGVKPSYLANIEQGREYWQTPIIDKDGKITIPDCKPEPTEFAKNYGEVLDNVVIAFATWNNDIIQRSVQAAVDEGRKVCKELDRLAADNKALSEKIRGLEELIEHIKNILSAAIERPDEIAIDWKEFLLKSLAKP